MICRQIGDRAGEAVALLCLGELARGNADYPAADAHFRAALAICRQIGKRAGEAAALWGLGNIAKINEHPDQARERWQTAHAIYLRTGSPLSQAVRKDLEQLG